MSPRQIALENLIDSAIISVHLFSSSAWSCGIDRKEALMLKTTTAFLLLVLWAGVAAADGPEQSFGPAGPGINLLGDPDRCQYGFQDDQLGSGWSLYSSQQLGIRCGGPISISGVGFYVEFAGIPGTLDIVIYDGATEVQRTAVIPQVGENNFDLPDIAVNDACIMLCPTSFDGVTGEDYTNGPFGNSYWSNSCGCSNSFPDNNLTIWAELGGATPVSSTTWGSLKTLYR
jgi:hypothetical protein